MRAKAFFLLLALAGTETLTSQTVDLLGVFEQIPISGRLDWLESKAPADLPDDFLFQALLMTDAANVEGGTTDEVAAKTSTATWLCQRLGERKSQASVLLIRRLPAEYRNVDLRVAAWSALAQIGDKDSIPDMILALKTLNVGFRRNNGAEREALALVTALSNLKAADAFPDLLRASSGWYSSESQVRTVALKSLRIVAPDYSEALLSVLRNDADTSSRQAALRLALADQDPNLKLQASVAALKVSLELQSNDETQTDIITDLRKTSLRVLAVAPKVPTEAVPDLRAVLQTWTDAHADPDDPKWAAQALGNNGETDAVHALAAALSLLSSRQKGGANTPGQVLLARTIIDALGTARSPDGRTALIEVEYSSYTPAIVREAQEAQTKIGAK